MAKVKAVAWVKALASGNVVGYATNALNTLGHATRLLSADQVRELLAAERERCAQVCELRGKRIAELNGTPAGDRDEYYCADDIRALPDDLEVE